MKKRLFFKVQGFGDVVSSATYAPIVKSGTLLLACLLFTTSVLAEPTVYALTECIASGLQHSTRLANARRDSEIAEAQIKEVQAQLYPQASIRGQYTYIEQIPSSVDTNGVRRPMGRHDNYLFGGEISQLIYAGGSIRAGLQATGAYREIAQAMEQQGRTELERDIRHAFTQLLLAKAVAEVREQTVTQLEAWSKQVEARFHQGLASEFELNSAKVRAANERPPLIRARADITVARTRLRNLARLEETNFDVSGHLGYQAFTNGLERLQIKALGNRPEIIQARKNVDFHRAAVKAVRGSYAPRVRLRAGSSARNPPINTALNEYDWSWDAGVVAEWLILDGGARRSEVRQKRLQLEKAEEDLGEIQRMIVLEIEVLYAECMQAEEAVAATAENVDLARQNLTIARTRYDTGLVTYLEFTDAELALRNASLGRLKALADHERSVAAMVCATGG